MKVGYNCLHLIPGRLGGLETYLHTLLDDVGKEPSPHEFVIYCSTQFRSEFTRYADRFAIVNVDVNVHSAARRVHWEQFVLPGLLAKHHVDVLHSSGYTAPITHRCKTVMTVHDLNYIEIPRLIRRSHGRARWAVMRFLGPLSMKRSDRILTDSHHVRRQISRFFHIAPEKITTIYARPPCDFSKIRAAPPPLPPGLERDFLLYVASWLPHKNHELLFQAMAEARRRRVDLPPLVLAGLHLRSDAQRASLFDALRHHGLDDRVHCVEEHLSVENLAYLYQQAKLFVFPTLFEGFGIPVLEAMSARLPVLCSNIEPVSEIAGGAARLFSPSDPLELLGKLAELNADHDLREQLANRGYQRYLALQQASQSAGAQVLSLYESVARSVG